MIGFKKIRLLMNRVLVKRVEPVAKTKGGILLPESKGEQLNYGTIVEVGPGLLQKDGKLMEWTVKVGDTVLLPQYGGMKIVMADNEEFYLYRDDDIVGILSEKVQ